MFPTILRVAMLIAAVCSCLSLSAALTVDVAVQVSPSPQVTITWNSQGSNSVHIARRPLGDMGIETWNIIAEGASSPYVDTTVVNGESYEYSVRSLNSNDDNRLTHFVATINAPLDEARGAALIVVEDTWAPELANEIANLELSLVGDGWVVERLDWGREGSGSEVDLKAAIQAAAANNPDINSLFLFGALPVVYSGQLAPDGHDARPHETDTFYADLDGQWDDSADFAGFIPGDGEYDENYYPSSLELRTGRVTFHDMDAYQKNEVEYLRDYIHKEHAYRYGHRSLPYRNYTGDEYELWPTNATLRAMVGAGNYLNQDNLDQILDDPYLFAFGFRNSSWSPARDGFQMGIFTACSRSYAQEFWKSDNRMRGMLSQPDWGLTALWGGRPAWYMHKMAAGLPIGVSVIDTQNDYMVSQATWVYADGVWTKVQGRDYDFNSDTYHQYSKAFVSNNLMGDPTLRITQVVPVSDLAISRTNASNVQLTWTASPSVDLIGYHVYASNDRLGPYTRLTATPITGTSYSASAANNVETWFQVRAIADVTVPTGVYEDQSHGRFAVAYDDGSVNTPPTANDLTVTGKINTPLHFNFSGADVDGDTLTPILLDNPDSGQIRWYQGQPFYVSKRDEPGTDTATFVMFDGVTVSDPATVTFITDEVGDTLLAWELPDNSVAAQPSTFNHPHVTSTSIAGGPGTSMVSPWPGTDALTSRYIGANFDANADYFVWTVTPESGYQMNIDRINLGICGDHGDSISYELRVSDDGFASHEVVPMSLGNVKGAGFGGNTGTLDTADASGVGVLQNQDQPVEFRLHFWHTGGTESLGIGKITDPVYYDAIEDVSFIGSVVQSNTYFAFTNPSAYSPQDGAQNKPTNISISGDNLSATLTGNAWKGFPLAYTVTPNTVLEVTVNGPDAGEIIGVALDDDDLATNSRRSFIFGGSTVNGSNHSSWAWTIGPQYQTGTTMTYTIPVGSYFTGTVNTLGLIADDDANGSTNITFSNLKIYEGEAAVDPLIDFNAHALTSYTSGQDGNGPVLIEDGGDALHLTGNRWQKINYSYNITPGTLLEFDFQSSDVGELIGVGFDDDNEYQTQPYSIFKVAGADGAPGAWLDFTNDYYAYASGVDKFVIPVGEYYTGAMNSLCFVGDDDANASTDVVFSNVRVYEGTLVDFDNYSIITYDAGQDGAYGHPTSASTSEGGVTINLQGNAWKRIALPYDVTSDTVIEVELTVNSGDTSELVLIGFENDNTISNDKLLFQLAGSDNWANAYQELNQYGSGTEDFVIPVGSFYTGPMSHLVLAADDDANGGSNVTFKNIRIYENP